MRELLRPWEHVPRSRDLANANPGALERLLNGLRLLDSSPRTASGSPLSALCRTNPAQMI